MYANAIFPPNVDRADAATLYTVQEDRDSETGSNTDSNNDLLPPNTRSAQEGLRKEGFEVPLKLVTVLENKFSTMNAVTKRVPQGVRVESLSRNIIW